MSEWTVGGYTEIRTLGEGAQGRVVLARHDASGIPVAIKYVSVGGDDAQREALRHEARMLGRAENPHIARLHGLVETPGGAAIVMEAIDGVSLKELLARDGVLGPEAALGVLKGSLLGLAAAHALGVVHRDYKPANVVVPGDGMSRLVDFGIAAAAGAETGGAGTPYYMAPEQWERHVATPATDVYAATCVFIECLTGSRPYRGTLSELRAAHSTGEIPVMRVPGPLRPLVARGMAKSPWDRPSGAAAFVAELEALATAAYGADWEQRGVRALAAAASALASLFPLAAWLAPGAGSPVAGTGEAVQGAMGGANDALAHAAGDVAGAGGAGQGSVQAAGSGAAHGGGGAIWQGAGYGAGQAAATKTGLMAAPLKFLIAGVVLVTLAGAGIFATAAFVLSDGETGIPGRFAGTWTGSVQQSGVGQNGPTSSEFTVSIVLVAGETSGRLSIPGQCTGTLGLVSSADDRLAFDLTFPSEADCLTGMVTLEYANGSVRYSWKASDWNLSSSGLLRLRE